MSNNLIPCLAWVKQGYAKSRPDKLHLSPEELNRVIRETKGSLNYTYEDIADDDLSTSDSDDEAHAENLKQRKRKILPTKKNKTKKKTATVAEAAGEADGKDDADIIDKYGFDDYDEDIADSEAIDNFVGLSYYQSNDDDPYMTIRDEDSDEEDFVIKSTDNLIMVPRVKQEHNIIEVYVYNDAEGGLYIHHDFLISSFPLSIEWMNFNPGNNSSGNFMAMGTMEPVIEIWDIDLVDNIEPSFTLGQKHSNNKKKKKSGRVEGHTDAVIDLSWNHNSVNVLASASADNSVVLWDLAQQTVAKTINKHSDKVQALSWHPEEAQTLLSGGFDKSVYLFDCRNPDESYKTWNLQGEIETLLWNHHSPYHCLVATDGGFVYLLDVRTDKTVFTLSAHTSPCTGISLSSQVPGLLVTSSTDSTIKVWDIIDNKPKMIKEKNLGQGELLCCSCCPDAPYVFAIGGSRDLTVMDLRESIDVKNHFSGRSVTSLTSESTSVNSDLLTTESQFSMDALSLSSAQQTSVDKTNTAYKKKQTKRKKKKVPTATLC